MLIVLFDFINCIVLHSLPPVHMHFFGSYTFLLRILMVFHSVPSTPRRITLFYHTAVNKKVLFASDRIVLFLFHFVLPEKIAVVVPVTTHNISECASVYLHAFATPKRDWVVSLLYFSAPKAISDFVNPALLCNGCEFQFLLVLEASDVRVGVI